MALVGDCRVVGGAENWLPPAFAYGELGDMTYMGEYRWGEGEGAGERRG